eukprot:4385470-Amphidinium_carterae.1
MKLCIGRRVSHKDGFSGNPKTFSRVGSGKPHGGSECLLTVLQNVKIVMERIQNVHAVLKGAQNMRTAMGPIAATISLNAYCSGKAP